MRWHYDTCLFALRIWTCLEVLSCPPASATGKTAADYYVKSLPGQPDEPLLNMHAGHIEVTPEHHGNLFFWLFENRHIANRKRTVIWLNGGPGCSSMDGALMEIGPYRLKDKEHLVYNEGSWHEFANLLFVDNPVGTGFSYVDSDSYVHELDEMADQLIVFMEKFFAIFPEHEDNDIYLSGESYAGQHIPYLAQAILNHNSSPTKKKLWKLSGLLIGNGWISPTEQYHAYAEYAFAAGLIKEGSKEAEELEPTQKACNEALNEAGGAERVSIPACENVLVEVLRLSKSNNRCVNMYDVRLTDDYPSCGMAWPPDLTNVTPYLRRKDVLEALHVNKAKQTGWTECGGSVGDNFRAEKSKASITMLPRLIEQVPTLLFSGDQDLICNHLGTEEMIHNMEWNGAKGFELVPGTWAPRRDWTFEGKPAGFYQEARNLTYIVFYNASHMVPFDYPRRTRDMLDRFIGVDIASIGGPPYDSRIDGEKGLETSVGGHPNSTSAEEAEKIRLEEAKWTAYYKSGEVALVIVSILATVWGWYVWRERRSRTGYQGLFTGSTRYLFQDHALRVANGPDIEAADFDESELDDLNTPETGEESYDSKHNRAASSAVGRGHDGGSGEPRKDMVDT